ncbi:MAG: hypothetical protein ABI954_00570 [Pyrinomonadaceae bacterium]
MFNIFTLKHGFRQPLTMNPSFHLSDSDAKLYQMAETRRNNQKKTRILIKKV